MDYKLRKKEKTAITEKISIPLSAEQEGKARWLKSEFKLDLNDAIRKYIDDLYFKAKSGELILE